MRITGVLHYSRFWFKTAKNKPWVMEILPILFDMVVTGVYTIVINSTNGTVKISVHLVECKLYLNLKVY